MKYRPLKLFMVAKPKAYAEVYGDKAHPKLYGKVYFYKAYSGVLMTAEMHNLPYDKSSCASNICAMHIHTGNSCVDDLEIPFMEAGGHYNPNDCPHPAHAGDLPPLFSNHGYAFQAFYTERFTIEDIKGRTVIIHSQRDDFTTQPSGDSGSRIGCGVII